MSYPANHTPDARDGVEGLLEQIAKSVGAITDESSSIEDKLASIAVALQSAAGDTDADVLILTASSFSGYARTVDATNYREIIINGDAGGFDATTYSLTLSNAAPTNHVVSVTFKSNLVGAFVAVKDAAGTTLTTLRASSELAPSRADFIRYNDGVITNTWNVLQVPYRAFASVRECTGATDTILASDVGGIIVYNSGSDVTVTCPKNFQKGTNVVCVQQGAGQVKFEAQSGGTLTNVESPAHYWTKGPGAVCSLIVFAYPAANQSAWVLTGATAVAT